jgi:hypothetical protein
MTEAIAPDRHIMFKVLKKRFNHRSEKILWAVTKEISEELELSRMMVVPVDAQVHAERFRMQMEGLYRRLDEELNPSGEKRIAFALLLREFGVSGPVNFVSNAERPGMLGLLRSFLDYMDKNPNAGGKV